MGGPTAEVFFAEPVDDRLEGFLRTVGAKFKPRPKKAKPKKLRQASWDISITPNQLGLAPGDWDASVYYKGNAPTESMLLNIDVRNIESATSHWDYLLENDVLPEDMSQVVGVLCYTKGPIAYDAVNALTAALEQSLQGTLRTSAQK